MRPVDELPYLEWTEDSGEVRRIYADVWKQEEITLPAEVTKHAVESAVKITDHYRKDTRTVRVELFFSGSPIRGDLDPEFEGETRAIQISYPEWPRPPLFSPRGLTQAVESAVGLAPAGQSLPRSISVLQFSQPPAQRHRKALELIDRLQTEGILLTVGGSMLRLESLAVVSCIGHRDETSGDGGSIALDLDQITFTASDVAVAVPLPLEVRAQPKKAGAAGSTTEVTGPKKTVAAALVDEVIR